MADHAPPTDTAQKFDREAFFHKAVTRWARRAFKRSGTPPGNALAGSCLYRSADGSACLIGLCIPDDLYQPAFEGHSVYRLLATPMVDDALTVATFGVPRDNITYADMMWLHQLQAVHDASYDGPSGQGTSSAPAVTWPEEAWRRLTVFAHRNGVTLPPGIHVTGEVVTVQAEEEAHDA